MSTPTVDAAVVLFDLTWDPADHPDGYATAVAYLAAHAIDIDQPAAADTAVTA